MLARPAGDVLMPDTAPLTFLALFWAGGDEGETLLGTLLIISMAFENGPGERVKGFRIGAYVLSSSFSLP
ncbi:hypothetical protein E2C01_084581 [Portunus trituberculatus]|uniref:Uncharacterized protein n=1 Tax=Portunus trituberculatus TaxID=210409 RepID=A0A5B7J846_PORTR|nr:hypothetical protein [Portunus trituberculatus]